MSIKVYFKGGEEKTFSDYDSVRRSDGVVSEIGGKSINPDNVLWSEPVGAEESNPMEEHYISNDADFRQEFYCSDRSSSLRLDFGEVKGLIYCPFCGEELKE